MRRIAIAVMSTISGLVLLFSYHTSTGQSSVAGHARRHQFGGSGSAIRVVDANGPAGRAARVRASDSGTATVTGDAVQTRWGAVQVRITVKDGKITASEAIVYPNDNRHDVRDQRLRRADPQPAGRRTRRAPSSTACPGPR